MNDHAPFQGDQGQEARGLSSTHEASWSGQEMGHQLTVRIDEVVLHGFSRSDGQTVADALRDALSELLRDDHEIGEGAESVNLDCVDMGALRLPRSARAQVIGQLAARAIHRRLSQSWQSR